MIIVVKEWIRRRSIRWRLSGLVAACVLPVWLASGYLLHYSYQSRLALVERHMQETARSLMLASDRELSNIQAALQALATSPALDSGDLAAFHAQARELLASYPDADIIMADADGQQRVNSYRPFGSVLPKRGNVGLVRRVFETGQPVISDLFKGAVTGRPLISVDMPVVRDGRVVHDLAMTAPADRLSAALARQQLPPDWTASLLDGVRVLVASSRPDETGVGRPVAGLPALRQSGDGAEGLAEGEDREGVQVRVAFSRSAMSGWTAEVTVPKAALMADLWRWLRWVSALDAAVLLAGLFAAFVAGRGVARDVKNLAEGARHVAGGDLTYRVPGGDVSELADLAGAFNDMTEALQTSYGALKRSNRELRDFVRIASHDLQEPLRKIRTFGDRLRLESGDRLTGTGADSLSRMEKAAERMQELIEALLDYSRFGQTERPFRPTDLGEAARRAAADLEARRAETGGRIEIVGVLPTIEADRVQMRQLFQSLLSNALKFHRPEEPPEVLVRGRLLREDSGEEMCQITVEDRGIGFEERYLDRIFSPFQRLHGKSRYPGTGMGLAIVRRIAERHGGFATAKSVPGQGATFIVTLRAAARERPLVELPTESG